MIAIANSCLPFVQCAYDASHHVIQNGICTMNILTQALLWKVPEDLLNTILDKSNPITNDELDSVKDMPEGLSQVLQFGFLYGSLKVYAKLIPLLPTKLLLYTKNIKGNKASLLA